jgi:hypothetical protein
MSYNPNNPNGSALSANSAPVVIASDQGSLPVVTPLIVAQPSSQSLAATGSIQWTVEPGGFFYLTITNAPAATATFVATVVFETSPDNSVWSAVNGNPLLGLPGATAVPVSTTSVVGVWKIQIPANAQYIRARVSARTSGTIWAYLEPVGIPNNTIHIPFTPSVTTANTLVGWIDTTGISEIALQVSAVTTTVVTVQGTNDPTGTVVQSVQVSNDNSSNQAIATTIAAAQTASIINPVHKWIRFQVTTTGTVFTIQGVTARFGQSLKLNAAQSSVGIQGTPTVNVATATTVTTVTTVGTVTKSNLGQPGVIIDVASAALTTTTTTGTITPTYGASFQVTIPVTIVTGTTPTLDVELQESRDGGTNWVATYDFPRITAVGFYTSPVLTMTGTVMRYVQTVSGTTPSFTRSLQRLQGNISTVTLVRQIIDRTISLTTLSSNTVNLISEQGTRNIQLTINIGAVTTAPVLQIMASDDAGATWYNVGSTLTSVASSTVSLTVNNVTAQFYRATVTTAGTGVTAGYVLLRAF